MMPNQTCTLSKQIHYQDSKVIELDPEILLRNRLTSFFDDSSISGQYKILRTQLLHITKEKGLSTILITSPNENEGKSLTAANLAISLAMEVEHTVLLVDADLRRPTLHKLFGFEPANGLSDALMTGKALPDILVNPGINKLTILPGRNNFSNSAEIIGSPAMKQLIKEMKHRYSNRYIIFDAPPAIDCPDTLILSQYVDGIILVAEYNKTTQDQIEKTLILLKNANILGTVLNKTRTGKKPGYY